MVSDGVVDRPKFLVVSFRFARTLRLSELLEFADKATPLMAIETGADLIDGSFEALHRSCL